MDRPHLESEFLEHSPEDDVVLPRVAVTSRERCLRAEPQMPAGVMGVHPVDELGGLVDEGPTGLARRSAGRDDVVKGTQRFVAGPLRQGWF